MQHGFEVLDLARIAAILDQSNITSRNLLCKLGFNIEKQFEIEPNSEKLDLYVINR